MKKLLIHSHARNYDVIFEKNLTFIDEYVHRSNRVFIIDASVYDLYKANFIAHISPDDFVVIDASEKNKNLSTVLAIYDTLLQKTAKKNLTVIAIGGGITQDIAGYVCSTLYRGVGWICVPTTLLSQVDSCIGSKTSLNYKTFKNILGTFYPPHTVHICQEFLKTLSVKDVHCGLGEIVKLQLMAMQRQNNVENIAKCIQVIKKFMSDRDVDISTYIYTSLSIKKKFIEKDEFDNNIRNLLNYGHEFGHALESSSSYNIPHGIAIAIGIIFSNMVSLHRRLLSVEFEKNLRRLLLEVVPLETKIIQNKYFLKKKILQGMKKDKKLLEANKFVLIVLKQNMQLEKLTDCTEQELTYCLSKIRQLLFLKKGVL